MSHLFVGEGCHCTRVAHLQLSPDITGRFVESAHRLSSFGALTSFRIARVKSQFRHVVQGLLTPRTITDGSLASPSPAQSSPVLGPVPVPSPNLGAPRADLPMPLPLVVVPRTAYLLALPCSHLLFPLAAHPLRSRSTSSILVSELSLIARNPSLLQGSEYE